MWKKIEKFDTNIYESEDYIFYNKSWVDEDENPSGVRSGWYSPDESKFVSARYENDFDSYGTRNSDEDYDALYYSYKGDEQIPTHFIKCSELLKLLKQ